MVEKLKPYWYLYYTEYCPICGVEYTTKERIYDKPRPIDYCKRHETKEVWNYCGI